MISKIEFKIKTKNNAEKQKKRPPKQTSKDVKDAEKSSNADIKDAEMILLVVARPLHVFDEVAGRWIKLQKR